MTFCVRFFSLLPGDTELVLEEALKSLLGGSSHDFLNVITYSVQVSGEKSA